MNASKRPIHGLFAHSATRLGLLAAVVVLVSLVSLSQTTSPGARLPRGPRAFHFETPEVSLGRLPAGSTRIVSLPWRRTGAGPLRVLEARSDCGCALIESAPEAIPQGGRGRLRVRVTAPRRPGPLRHRVRVVSDGPPGHDVTDAWISGHVGTDVAIDPARVDLPPGRAGTEAQTLLTVAWDRSTQGAAALPRARLIGLQGEVDVGPPPRLGADAAQLIVTLRRPSRPGRLAGWIEVDLGRRGPVAIPVRGVVHPARPEDAPARAR